MSFWQPKYKIYLAQFKIKVQIWPELSEEFNNGFKIRDTQLYWKTAVNFILHYLIK